MKTNHNAVKPQKLEKYNSLSQLCASFVYITITIIIHLPQLK